MHWLNLLATLLLGLGLLALLAFAVADILGLLNGPRWRTARGAASAKEIEPARGLGGALSGAEAAVAGGSDAEPAVAWILYLSDGRPAHRQPVCEGETLFIGRQAFPGLAKEVAFRAAEVVWQEGMPAIRNLDPACPTALRVAGEPEPTPLEAGAEWEPWPAGGEIALGGYVLRWEEAEE